METTEIEAIRLEEPGRFQRITIPEPARPGPGEALVRVHRIGICGTDIHAYLGNQPFYTYPRIPGHELGVEVVEVGADVTDVKPGDRCSVEPYLNCQTCIACRRGRTNCCRSLQVLGVHTDGGMRPLFIVPARKLHKSDTLSTDQLALVETLGIGCHAVGRGQPEAGENVLVIGAGPIGLSVILFARLAGSRITVLDLNRKRLDFCLQAMGVDHTIVADEEAFKTIEDLTDGDMPTVVFDATGSPRSMCNAFNYVAHTGKLVFVGLVTSEITFADPMLHAREITLLASRNARPDEFKRIIHLIEDGSIDTRAWITHRTSFDAIATDFPQYTQPETGVIKAVVEIRLDGGASG